MIERPLLQVLDLSIGFETHKGFFTAVDNVHFQIKPSETLALVGESGCGKSVTALSLLRLLDCPPARIMSGQILFEGEDLLKLGDEHLRKVRGNKISMIFQEPMTSLNPVFTIGDQIAEVFRIHQNCSRQEAKERAIDMLRLVKIPAAEKCFNSYPHEFSGGMRQRVMIAIALACRPKLLIADEPTTALDVTIQAQILDLIDELKDHFKMSVLLITHDLGVVAEFCDQVVVMYAGSMVEQASVADLFQNPKHPYTQCLMESIPRLGQGHAPLKAIGGIVPSLDAWPTGCKFHTRCPKVFEPCKSQRPQLCSIKGQETHKVSCWLEKRANG